MKRLVKRNVSRVARYVAREMADELSRSAISDAPNVDPDAPQTVRLDIPDALEQLSSNKAEMALVQFFAWNHRWVAQLSERNRRTAVSTYDFVEAQMNQAVFMVDQFKVIESKADQTIELDGQILDFGVYKGASTRALARIFPDRKIHGFDSFEGLPEDWSHDLKGSFGHIAGALPSVPNNVSLWPGWFEDSLPQWMQDHSGSPISILRIDCDIYSSTKTIFDVLEPLIQAGTWIVFDELIGLRGWEQHEYKAFLEFIERTGFDYEYIAYGLSYTIVRLSKS